MAEIQIDIEDYLDEVDTKVLEDELRRRRKKCGDPFSSISYCSIPEITAHECLEASSSVMRKIGRIDLAYKLDEIRNDYF